MGGKVPKIQIRYSNPPSIGKITIRRPIQHPLWGLVWIEREVGPESGLLSSNEAATYLGISLVWLYKLVKKGALHTQRKKGRLVFRFRELRRYKQQNR